MQSGGRVRGGAGGVEVVRPPPSDSGTPCSRPGLVLPCPARLAAAPLGPGAGSGRARGARLAVKRRTKAAPERAQVVASGRGAGPSHPPRGAGGRAGLCPGDCGGRGARREELRYWFTSQAADRPAVLGRLGSTRPGWRGTGAEVIVCTGRARLVTTRLLNSPRRQSG